MGAERFFGPVHTRMQSFRSAFLRANLSKRICNAHVDIGNLLQQQLARMRSDAKSHRSVLQTGSICSHGNGTERNGKERNGTERKGKERNGTERKGTERMWIVPLFVFFVGPLFGMKTFQLKCSRMNASP